MQSLISGLIGALIATLLSILYNFIAEQLRFRREIMLAVVSWADGVYIRLQEMHVQKERIYNGKSLGLTDEEYRIMSREVKTMLLSAKIGAMVALVYGEGDEMQKINAFRGELTKVLEGLYGANKETWSGFDKKISEKFKNIIDPLRMNISRRFLEGTTVKSIFLDWIRKHMPTMCKLIKNFKKTKLLK